MFEQYFQIRGVGKYLPSKCVHSSEIDSTMGYASGYTEARTGIATRYYAGDELASSMAAKAIAEALNNAGASLNDVDCLMAACGTMEQAIPCNAANINALLQPKRAIPAFDINMTCLSFLMAFELAAQMIAMGKYKQIMIVSSDIASVGIDWEDVKVGGNFGDGAAAVLLSSSNEKACMHRVLASHFETYHAGSELCQIKGVGTAAIQRQLVSSDMSQFKMKGKALYRMAAEILPGFVDTLLDKVELTMDDIDWVMPHQASYAGLLHMQKKLGVSHDRFINIIKSHGNQVAASLPTVLHHLWVSRQLKPKDKILLLGTGAGLSFGALVLEV